MRTFDLKARIVELKEERVLVDSKKIKEENKQAKREKGLLAR